MRTMRLLLRDEEGLLAIEALAELPFKTVFELIGELNRQAVSGAGTDDAGRRYDVDRDQLELLLGALAQLPYARVHRLLASLARQLEHAPGVPA